jgi:hypothetical protein
MAGAQDRDRYGVVVRGPSRLRYCASLTIGRLASMRLTADPKCRAWHGPDWPGRDSRGATNSLA